MLLFFTFFSSVIRKAHHQPEVDRWKISQRLCTHQSSGTQAPTASWEAPFCLEGIISVVRMSLLRWEHCGKSHIYTGITATAVNMGEPKDTLPSPGFSSAAVVNNKVCWWNEIVSAQFCAKWEYFKVFLHSTAKECKSNTLTFKLLIHNVPKWFQV